jgi:TonB family protein
MKALFTIMLLFCAGTMFGQSDTIPPRFKPDSNYMDFVSKVVRYPRDAAIKGIQGRVDFVFQIDSVGCINSIKIVESPDEDLSEALIRALLKTKCDWIPANIDGKPANSSLKSYLVFKLE